MSTMATWRGGAMPLRLAHWPEYLIEAAGLGLFMVSACSFGTLLGHPASPVVQGLPAPVARRALMGIAMGLTAVSLIYSRWGRRSGAHFNPATTLTFWRLGKLETADAVLYMLAQAVGGLIGVLLAALALGAWLADPAVCYVATRPGAIGPAGAFVAECVITFVLMSVVLRISNDPRRARPAGPGIELLEYLTPRDGRPAPADARANDLAHWQTALVTADAEAVAGMARGSSCGMLSPSVVAPTEPTLGFTRGLLLRDPDGHALQVVQP